MAKLTKTFQKFKKINESELSDDEKQMLAQEMKKRMREQDDEVELDADGNPIVKAEEDEPEYDDEGNLIIKSEEDDMMDDEDEVASDDVVVTVDDEDDVLASEEDEYDDEGNLIVKTESELDGVDEKDVEQMKADLATEMKKRMREQDDEDDKEVVVVSADDEEKPIVDEDDSIVIDGEDEEEKKAIELAKAEACKTMRESVSKLFKGSTATKKFISQTTALIEAAVNDRVKLTEQRLAASYNKKLNKHKVKLEKTVGTYVDMFAEEFVEKNRLAIETGLRVQLAEQLLESIAGTYKSFNIKIDDDKVDLYEQSQADLKAAKAKANKLLAENVQLKADKQKGARKAIVAQVSEGLTTSQKERLNALVETIEFRGNDKFEQDVKFIRSKFFTEAKAKKVASKTEELNEEIAEPTAENVDSEMKQYMDYAQRLNKK